MSVMLQTTLGDIVVDLDLDGSPSLCHNFLKLTKARYYTNTLIYNVQQLRFCQMGDPRGDGTGGCSIFGLMDATENGLSDETSSKKRFIKSQLGNKRARELTKAERNQRGVVAIVEMGGVEDTIGSQFLITLGEGEGMSLDGMELRALSLGVVMEDENDVLGKINSLYCDEEGRPFQDVRVKRALIVHDPYEDPEGMERTLTARDVDVTRCVSPDFSRPNQERVEPRISAEEDLSAFDGKSSEIREENLAKKEAKSRAVVLEMLGDLPDADAKVPENVLFVCKLNPVTRDDDLELIFQRFDPKAKANIVRDQESGESLCYAFVEFSSKEQCNEAYLKMNNALIDDRRIKVDFSQSVAKEWNKFSQSFRSKSFGRNRLDSNGNQRLLQSNHDPIHRDGRSNAIPTEKSRMGSSYSSSGKVAHTNRAPKQGRDASHGNGSDRFSTGGERGNGFGPTRPRFHEKNRVVSTTKKFDGKNGWTGHEPLTKNDNKRDCRKSRGDKRFHRSNVPPPLVMKDEDYRPPWMKKEERLNANRPQPPQVGRPRGVFGIPSARFQEPKAGTQNGLKQSPTPDNRTCNVQSGANNFSHVSSRREAFLQPFDGRREQKKEGILKGESCGQPQDTRLQYRGKAEQPSLSRTSTIPRDSVPVEHNSRPLRNTGEKQSRFGLPSARFSQGKHVNPRGTDVANRSLPDFIPSAEGMRLNPKLSDHSKRIADEAACRPSSKGSGLFVGGGDAQDETPFPRSNAPIKSECHNDRTRQTPIPAVVMSTSVKSKACDGLIDSVGHPKDAHRDSGKCAINNQQNTEEEQKGNLLKRGSSAVGSRDGGSRNKGESRPRRWSGRSSSPLSNASTHTDDLTSSISSSFSDDSSTERRRRRRYRRRADYSRRRRAKRRKKQRKEMERKRRRKRYESSDESESDYDSWIEEEAMRIRRRRRRRRMLEKEATADGALSTYDRYNEERSSSRSGNWSKRGRQSSSGSRSRSRSHGRGSMARERRSSTRSKSPSRPQECMHSRGSSKYHSSRSRYGSRSTNPSHCSNRPGENHGERSSGSVRESPQKSEKLAPEKCNSGGADRIQMDPRRSRSEDRNRRRSRSRYRSRNDGRGQSRSCSRDRTGNQSRGNGRYSRDETYGD